jgi:phosphatidylinositol alpha-mannosyltransferase
MSGSKLKIGFVLDDTLDTPDGVHQHVLMLGKWMLGQGHEVHYLVGETNRDDLENIHSMARNIKVRFNKNRLSVPLPTNRKVIKEKLDELKLDVIHVQMPYSPFFAGRVIDCVSKKTKIIGTFHIVPANWLHHSGAQILELLVRKSIKKFDQIISVSEPAKEFAKEVFKVDSIVIPNPIDLNVFEHKPKYNSHLKIVFLGRLVERKGCMYLLKAINILQSNSKEKHEVIIGGKGPLEKKLKAYVKSKKLKNIKFVGFVDEEKKPDFLSSADIAVFPSTGGESFGISLTEAMAAGSRVVLGGNNPGYNTVLSDHPDLLIDPKDTKAFANRLQYYLEHEKARESARKWAAESVKQYDINLVGQKVLIIYKKQK